MGPLGKEGTGGFGREDGVGNISRTSAEREVWVSIPLCGTNGASSRFEAGGDEAGGEIARLSCSELLVTSTLIIILPWPAITNTRWCVFHQRGTKYPQECIRYQPSQLWNFLFVYLFFERFHWQDRWTKSCKIRRAWCCPKRSKKQKQRYLLLNGFWNTVIQGAFKKNLFTSSGWIKELCIECGRCQSTKTQKQQTRDQFQEWQSSNLATVLT